VNAGVAFGLHLPVIGSSSVLLKVPQQCPAVVHLFEAEHADPILPAAGAQALIVAFLAAAMTVLSSAALALSNVAFSSLVLAQYLAAVLAFVAAVLALSAY